MVVRRRMRDLEKGDGNDKVIDYNDLHAGR